MCYYQKPPSPGGQIATNSQALEPRFPLVYGIQDDIMLEDITLSSSSDRFFTWQLNFKKANGLPLEAGDVETILAVASIGDQDSTPRSLLDFGMPLVKNVERINMDLITFGKTYLTFEVAAEPDSDGVVPLWNCTCFTSTSIATKAA